MSYSVYILLTSSNTFYTGQTNNLIRRLEEHRTKGSKSAKYVRFFNSFELVYQESFISRAEAMKREAQLKTWSRIKKELLINDDKIALKNA
ncbi:MAG: GIY-YIG nuclease family protein [Patescibacteria group bacterium]